MEKVYHIYAKEECLYNNLSEEQFNNTWETLKGMVGLMKTDYELEDLSYEECIAPLDIVRQILQSQTDTIHIDNIHTTYYN